MVLYLLLMALGAVSSSVKVILLARLLAKADFGQYTYLNSVVMYGVPLVTLGILEAMGRRFPILIGQNRAAEAYELRNRVVWALLMTGTGAVLLAAVGGLAAQQIASQPLFAVVLLVTIEMYVYAAFMIAVRDVRSHLRTTLYAAIMFLRGVLELALMFFLAPRFGYIGVMVSEIVIWSAVTAALFMTAMPQFRLVRGSIRSVAPLIREGAVLSVTGILANTARMADRLVLGAMLTKTRFADYAFHLLVVSVGVVAANVIHQYVWPRALHLYGSTGGDLHAVDRYLRRLAIGLAALGVALAPAVPFVFHFAAQRFFPAYRIDTVLILLLYAAAVADVANMFPLVLMTAGRMSALNTINVAAAVIVAVGCVAVARTGADLRVCGVLALSARLIVLAGTAWAAHGIVGKGVPLQPLPED